MNNNSIPDWQLEENEARTERYRRPAAQQAFLYRLNDELAVIEEELEVPEVPPHPIVLFFGVPRCGKTFFSQLVTQALDLGYVDNIAARLWRAPVHGLRLSKILNPRDDESDYRSDYGKTRSLRDPHDFHYFWHYWLRVLEFPYNPDSEKARIDWNGLARALSRMSAEWGRPGILKAVDATYHMSQVVEAYPKVLFVYLTRDYIDSARSLFKGRVDNYGSPDAWYGQAPLPEHFESLKSLPWYEQIGGQFKYLTDMFETQLASVDPSRVIRLNYQSVCESPEAALETIVERCEQLGSTVRWH